MKDDMEEKDVCSDTSGGRAQRLGSFSGRWQHPSVVVGAALVFGRDGASARECDDECCCGHCDGAVRYGHAQHNDLRGQHHLLSAPTSFVIVSACATDARSTSMGLLAARTTRTGAQKGSIEYSAAPPTYCSVLLLGAQLGWLA